MSETKPRKLWMDPQIGDVLELPSGVRRTVTDTYCLITYTYVNASGAMQTVSSRLVTWRESCRRAERDGGQYIRQPNTGGAR